MIEVTELTAAPKNLEKTSYVFAEDQQTKSRKERVLNVISKPKAALVMTLITVYTLFFDDLRVIFFPKILDDLFYTLSTLAMLSFIVEMALSIYAVDEYFLSFVFWLDLLSTVTMVPDIGWLWFWITGGNQTSSGQATDLARAARASKVTRLVRVVRLLRIIRVVKLYK